MAGRWILVPTTSVRFTPSRPSFWCGVIQRQDGLLIRAPPGFDSQRRNHAFFAFEAHEDEQAALNRQAVSSILTGRTKSSEPRPSGSRSKIPGLWLNGEALDF